MNSWRWTALVQSPTVHRRRFDLVSVFRRVNVIVTVIAIVIVIVIVTAVADAC